MDSLAVKKPLEHDRLIAYRYRVESELGRGGMAVVYLVHDTSTEKRLALKLLKAKSDEKKERKVRELFEREFHTLSHLSHPRVIAVYDYGVDEAGTYYTMELLDGGDLQKRAPIEWRKACQLILDVCSALSLLHSRRMVHRDLTPRNVRCTEDGLAKLIDFGAMIPMGPCKQVVGTAPFVAPEVVNLQMLDGRADLYSLGATFYYTLTGRFAYSARDFKQLRNRWRIKPPPPSELVKDIPEPLDRLVMSLLHLDPVLRPANAAEVMERLGAIADIKIDEQLLVTQAYLSSPTLAGRDWSLARVRKKIIRARRGRGSTLIVRGASGVGRSRFLNACMLEGKLAGATVLSADATSGTETEYGVVQDLVYQLLEAAPAETLAAAKPRAKLLGHILPELLERNELTSLAPVDKPDRMRPRLQTALSEMLFEISRNRTLVITVDDLHRVDEPSAAFIAFLAHQAKQYAMLIAVSIETGVGSTSEAALSLLNTIGKRIDLKNLDLDDSEKLLSSVFGAVPNLHLLADRLYRISEGNPRNLMQLAQHLVDKKLVLYQAGGWSLPDRLEASDLPISIAQTLKATIDALSADACQLATAMALSPEQKFSFDDVLMLTEHRQAGRLTHTISELVAAGVIRADNELYQFSQQGWISALRENIDASLERELHLRLADMFRLRGEEPFRVAVHVLRAGDEEHGLDLLVQHTEQVVALTSENAEAFAKFVRTLPSEWLSIYIDAIELCKKRDRPRMQVYTLQRHFSAVSWMIGSVYTTFLPELLQQLSRDAGLADYNELDDTMEPMARLGRALELAQERYSKSPPEERVLEPTEAMRNLARVLVQTSAFLIEAIDYQLWKSLPSLQPLVPLSPALGIVEKLVSALGARLVGRCELTCREYRELLERIEQPDHAGLDDTYYMHIRYAVLRAVAMVEAAMGLESPLEIASEVEKNPPFETNALQLKKLYYLWQGYAEKAEYYRKTIELHRIHKKQTRLFDSSQLSRELTAYALSDDFTGVKSVFSGIKRMAEQYPAWEPILLYAQGEYQRIRGDYKNARKYLEDAMDLVAAGEHQNWTDIVAAHLRTLLELKQIDRVVELGTSALETAEREDLGYLCNYIRMPLAQAYCKLGDRENAVMHANAVVRYFREIGATGINLGLAYETRARIAIDMKDAEGYKMYHDLCAEQFIGKNNRALAAKVDKLEEEAEHPELGLPDGTASAVETDPQSACYKLTQALMSCNSSEERMRRLLAIFIEQSASAEGVVYSMQKDGPVLSAQSSNITIPANVESRAKSYISAELEDTADTTASSSQIGSSSAFTTAWTGVEAEEYRPVLLGHHTKEGFAVTGLVLLLLDPKTKFKYPADIISTASKILLDAGDVATFVVSHYGTR
jgi:hypothetical protein